MMHVPANEKAVSLNLHRYSEDPAYLENSTGLTAMHEVGGVSKLHPVLAP
jgi:hypothetical protein